MFFLTRFVYKFEVISKENIEDIKPPFIIAANHKSYWDHFFLGAAAAPKFNSSFLPFRFLASDYLFRTLFGPFIVLLGGFRNYRGRGLEISLKKPLVILKNNGALIFYPEGGMVREADKIGEPRKGVGALALWSGVRIVPAALKGTRNRKDGIKVIFGQPFFIKDLYNPQNQPYAEEDFAKASRIIMDKIKELYFSV